MLESAIERSCKQYAEARGCLLVKMRGRVGIPDRVLLAQGRAVFIELKRPGEPFTRIQEYRARELNELGFGVYRVDSIEGFMELLDTFLEVVRISGRGAKP